MEFDNRKTIIHEVRRNCDYMKGQKINKRDKFWTGIGRFASSAPRIRECFELRPKVRIFR